MHLDPTGSAAGKRLKFKEDGVSEEEANFNEMMDGFGRKCLSKIIEAFILSAIVMAVLFFSGNMENVLNQFHQVAVEYGFHKS